MKETPILFSSPMVQAILAGRKTMTRRIVKPQPIWNVDIDGNLFEGNHKGYVKVDGHPEWAHQFAREFAKWNVGDVLWVRENFRVNSWVHDDGEVNFRYEADGTVSPYIGFDDDETFNRYWEQSCDDLLKAGYKSNDEERFEDYDYKALRLRPNIFLRKEAARIWLEVTDIRVERLNEIGEEDAMSEGIELVEYNCFRNYNDKDPYQYLEDPIGSFRSLWQSINGDESWASNPFCWVISFRGLSTTGKPDLITSKAKKNN